MKRMLLHFPPKHNQPCRPQPNGGRSFATCSFVLTGFQAVEVVIYLHCTQLLYSISFFALVTVLFMYINHTQVLFVHAVLW